VKKEKCSVTLDKDLIARIDKYAREERRNFSDTVNFVLARFFKKKYDQTSAQHKN